MIDQVKPRQLIPDIVLFLSMALLFGLMALPHSQYELLGEMNHLTNNTGETVNWGTLLPALFTFFVILLGVITALFAVLSLLITRFYTFHFVNNVSVVLACLTTILQLFYLFFGLGKTLDYGDNIIEVGNIIATVILVVGVVAYIFLYAILIEKPFLEIKHEMMATPSSPSSPYRRQEEEEQGDNDMEEEKKEDTEVQEETSNKSGDEEAKKKLRDLVLKEVASGEISPEEASKILENLDK